MTKEELLAQVGEDRSRLQEIDSSYHGQFIDPNSDDGKDWATRNQRIDDNRRTIEQMEMREARILELSDQSANRESGSEPGAPSFNTRRPGVTEDIYDLSTVRASMSNPSEQAGQLVERACRAIDVAKVRHPEADEARSKEHVQRLVEKDSDEGRLSRYILATASPTYKRAFGKYLMQQERSREEQAALSQAQMAERQMSLTAAAGGFAVPFELDPTLLNISNGVVNPIRQLADVKSITVDEWRGVTTTAVTAAYGAELTETTDNKPTLAQPTISTEKAQAFIPFSIEIGMDWTGFQGEMAKLFADAKDTLEADKFINGSGTNEPFGILTGLGASQHVNAASGQTFTLANLYSLVGSLPPRYRANAAFLGDLLIFNRIRQFDTVGSPAAVWVDSLQAANAGSLFGKSAYEASAMPDAPATAAEFLVFGDFSRYVIIDRVGLSVELVPHLFGTTANYPNGSRGLYAYWRNGGKVVDANAFRVLLGVA